MYKFNLSKPSKIWNGFFWSIGIKHPYSIDQTWQQVQQVFQGDKRSVALYENITVKVL